MNDWQSQDKFSEKVRDKVYDHGDTPSEGLWDKLDQRLDEEPLKKRGVVWWVPAAVIVLLGVVGFGLLHDNDESALSDNQVNTQTAAPQPVAAKPSEQARPQAPVAPQPATPPTTNPATHKATKQVASRKHSRSNSHSVHRATPVTHKQGIGAASLVAMAVTPNSNKPSAATQPAGTLLPDEPLPLNTTAASEGANPAVAATTPVDTTKQNPVADMRPLGLLAASQPELIPFNIEARQAFLPPVALPLPPVSVLSIAIVTNVSGLSSRYAPAQQGYTKQSADNINLVKKVSRGRINYEGGISMGVGLTDHLMLSGGFRLGSFSEKYTYGLISNTADPVNSGMQNPRYVTNPSLFYKNSGDSVIAGKGHTHINVYNFQEFPFTLTYYTPLDKTGNWNMVWEAGVSIMKISYASGAYIDVDRVGFLVYRDQLSYPGIASTLYNFNASVGVSYRLSEKISFEANPTLRYGLTSLVTGKSWMQQTPTFWGCNFTMRRHF